MSLAHRKRDGLEAMIYRLGTSKHAAMARVKKASDAKLSDEEKEVRVLLLSALYIHAGG